METLSVRCEILTAISSIKMGIMLLFHLHCDLTMFDSVFFFLHKRRLVVTTLITAVAFAHLSEKKYGIICRSVLHLYTNISIRDYQEGLCCQYGKIKCMYSPICTYLHMNCKVAAIVCKSTPRSCS